MTVTRIIAPPSVSVQSGKSVKINAVTDGDNKEQKLIFNVKSGDIEVSPLGVVKTEASFSDRSGIVTVISQSNPQISEDIEIKAKAISPLKIESEEVEMIGGGTFQFRNSFGEKASPHWKIVDFSPEKGKIDPGTGVYTAPLIISSLKTIRIWLKDRKTGQIAEAEIFLLPIEMRTGAQEKVHAFGKEVKLNIWSYRDGVNGHDNFSCQIISEPKIGVVRDGGFYLPPPCISKEETIKVLATSLSDSTKKVVLTLDIGFPLCRKCGKEINQNGECVDHGKVFGQIDDRLNRCPRCKSKGYDGNCLVCNFPNRKKYF